MALRAGTHRVGRANGMLQVRTYREGVAQKVGHDLIIDVGQWEAAAEVRENGTLSAVQLNADPRSLQGRAGAAWNQAPYRKDRADTRNTIDERILLWGIKPYRGLMGGLKVRDTVEVLLDVALPST